MGQSGAVEFSLPVNLVNLTDPMIMKALKRVFSYTAAAGKHYHAAAQSGSVIQPGENRMPLSRDWIRFDAEIGVLHARIDAAAVLDVNANLESESHG